MKASKKKSDLKKRGVLLKEFRKNKNKNDKSCFKLDKIIDKLAEVAHSLKLEGSQLTVFPNNNYLSF